MLSTAGPRTGSFALNVIGSGPLRSSKTYKTSDQTTNAGKLKPALTSYSRLHHNVPLATVRHPRHRSPSPTDCSPFSVRNHYKRCTHYLDLVRPRPLSRACYMLTPRS